MAGAFGSFVNGLRVFAFLDQSAHSAIADADRHVVHGSIIWKRKRIYRFDLVGYGISEYLRNRDPRQKTADCAFDSGVFERTTANNFSLRADDFKRARLPGTSRHDRQGHEGNQKKNK